MCVWLITYAQEVYEQYCAKGVLQLTEDTDKETVAGQLEQLLVCEKSLLAYVKGLLAIFPNHLSISREAVSKALSKRVCQQGLSVLTHKELVSLLFSPVELIRLATEIDNTVESYWRNVKEVCAVPVYGKKFKKLN